MLVTFWGVSITSNYHTMNKKRWWCFGIGQTICLKRDNHTNVCSPACVFHDGFNSLTFSGEYFILQSASMWLLKWNTSMIFVILFHILSSGDGRGKGACTALNLSRLHILSYAIVAPRAVSTPSCFTNESNHCMRIRKTCEGDLDLQLMKFEWREGSAYQVFYLLIEWRPWINVTSSPNNKLMTSWPTSKTLRTCCLFPAQLHSGVINRRDFWNWWVLCK